MSSNPVWVELGVRSTFIYIYIYIIYIYLFKDFQHAFPTWTFLNIYLFIYYYYLTLSIYKSSEVCIHIYILLQRHAYTQNICAKITEKLSTQEISDTPSSINDTQSLAIFDHARSVKHIDIGCISLMLLKIPKLHIQSCSVRPGSLGNLRSNKEYYVYSQRGECTRP